MLILCDLCCVKEGRNFQTVFCCLVLDTDYPSIQKDTVHASLADVDLCEFLCKCHDRFERGHIEFHDDDLVLLRTLAVGEPLQLF